MYSYLIHLWMDVYVDRCTVQERISSNVKARNHILERERERIT